VSFVVIGAFAPDSVAETGPAGPASFPLLFGVFQEVTIAGPTALPLLFMSGQGVEVGVGPEPVPDPILRFGDHSPDLLLPWLDAPFEGSEWIDHTPEELVFSDVVDSDFSLTDHLPATVFSAYGSGAYGEGLYGGQQIAALVFADHIPD
jgi:hypothetical protein